MSDIELRWSVDTICVRSIRTTADTIIQIKFEEIDKSKSECDYWTAVATGRVMESRRNK